MSEQQIRIPFGPVKGVKYATLHCHERAVERFRQDMSAGKVMCWLEGCFRKAKEIQLPETSYLKKLLDHNFERALYFSLGKPSKQGCIIFVVVNDVLKTVHSGEAPEFRKAKTAWKNLNRK